MSAPVHHVPPAHASRPSEARPETWGARRGVALVAVALGALLLSAPAWAAPDDIPPATPSPSSTGD